MKPQVLMATTLLLAGGLADAAGLSPAGAFTFTQVVKAAGLKIVPCPGKIGNASTRCATGSVAMNTVQAKLSRYKGWKQTDAWKGGNAGFTSTGKNQFVITVMPPISSKKGTLLIFGEF